MFKKLFALFGRTAKKTYVESLTKKPSKDAPPQAAVNYRDLPVSASQRIKRATSRPTHKFMESVRVLSTFPDPLAATNQEINEKSYRPITNYASHSAARASALSGSYKSAYFKDNSRSAKNLSTPALSFTEFTPDHLKTPVEICPYVSYSREAESDPYNVSISFLLRLPSPTSRFKEVLHPNPAFNPDWHKTQLSTEHYRADKSNVGLQFPTLHYKTDKANPTNMMYESLLLGLQYVLSKTPYAASPICFAHSGSHSANSPAAIAYKEALLALKQTPPGVMPVTASFTPSADLLSASPKAWLKKTHLPDAPLVDSNKSQDYSTLNELIAARCRLAFAPGLATLEKTDMTAVLSSSTNTALSVLQGALDKAQALTSLPPEQTIAAPTEDKPEKLDLTESLWKFDHPLNGLLHARLVAGINKGHPPSLAIAKLVTDHSTTASQLDVYFAKRTTGEYEVMNTFLKDGVQGLANSTVPVADFDADLQLCAKAITIDTAATELQDKLKAQKVEDETYFRTKRITAKFVPLLLSELFTKKRTREETALNLSALEDFIGDTKSKLVEHKTLDVLTRNGISDEINAIYKGSPLLRKDAGPDR